MVRRTVTLAYVGGSVSAMKVPATVAEPPAASRRNGGVATTSSEAEVSAAAGMTTPIVSGARMA